ncbi:MAG: NTP transferase domain-containing protein [Bacteroidetes bacterium]|nr:NTP transferase domain-containing protein [Bacteroidota bacterium]
MINILLPIAGRGSRFAEEGYNLPKPLISVHGIPMIEVVVNNIRPKCEHHFIFVALKEHLDHLGMTETLERIAPGCTIVPVTEVTEGAACTVLLARKYIDNNDHLMLANSDQWVDIDINKYLEEIEIHDVDGLIMTMWADDPKWSYVGFDNKGFVNNVVEKQVISNEATVGIYNFRSGSDFVRAADQMIIKNLRVNNEFYVAPAYNEMISWDAKITIYNVGKVGYGMYGLGVPNDLNEFLQYPVSNKILSK